jgi:uncharacterized protein YjbI with pentapeptide repeats
MKTILVIFSLFVASETFAQSSTQNLSMMAMTNACKGCDLSNSQLVGVDFSDKNLKNANFTGSVADTANFSGAELEKVFLTGGSFKSANFDGAKITVTETDRTVRLSGGSDGIYQTKIDFRSATFKNAHVDITVYESVFDGANFSGAKRVSINGGNCSFLSPKFNNLNRWHGNPSSFRNISIVGINKYLDIYENNFCSFGGNVSNAKFDNSNFDGDALMFKGFLVINGDLTGSSFRDASLQWSAFTNSNLTGADFTNANLTDANFEGANLTSVNFTGANLDGANLAGAILCETIDPKGTMLYFGCE